MLSLRRNVVLLACLRTICCTSIGELVSSIAAQEDRALGGRLEVCVVQVREYTADRCPVDDTMQTLVAGLESSYPVTITRHRPYVRMYRRRDASFVLMDASGFGAKFPAELVSKRLATHECYAKWAKFVVLVDGASNASRLGDLFGELGIVNYLVVPVQEGTEQAVAGRLYSWNHFSRRQLLFDMADHRPSTVDRYFPDKLGDVHGYRFYVTGQYEFPYLILLQRDGRTAGLLVEALRHLIVRQLNGTMSMRHTTLVPSGRTEFDVTFALADFREHFMHEFTLMERGGSCLLCPFRTERDFMSHLLKPFSLGIWLVLGTVLIACPLLARLFPRHFERNLVGMVFFGTGVPYRQPKPTRLASFAITVLVFFLSEAYNARIVSLMSLAKYYERPETVQELIRSRLLIANPDTSLSLLADQLPGKVLREERANQLYRERGVRMFNDYCTVSQCHMALLAASDLEGERGYKQYVMREQVMKTLLKLQLATHSPFHRRFVDYLQHYFESGMWMYRLEGLRSMLADMVDTITAPFASVVFHFDDLVCVWVLAVVGWLLGLACFIGELLLDALRTRWDVFRQRTTNRVPQSNLLHSVRQRLTGFSRFRVFQGYFD